MSTRARLRHRDARERRLRRRAAWLGLRLHHLAPTGAMARKLGPYYLTSERLAGAVVGYALTDLDAVAAFLRQFRKWQQVTEHPSRKVRLIRESAEQQPKPTPEEEILRKLADL